MKKKIKKTDFQSARDCPNIDDRNYLKTYDKNKYYCGIMVAVLEKIFSSVSMLYKLLCCGYRLQNKTKCGYCLFGIF